MSRKVIFVGECCLDIVFEGMRPVAAEAGSVMLDAALRLARRGIDVSFAGEASADRAGDFIVGTLAQAGVDTSMIDRAVDSSTPLRLVHTDAPAASMPTIYTRPSRERISFGWPMARPGDIIVFGGYFALDPRTRSEVVDFVNMCVERGMIIVNLPGFEPQLEPAITHVMPDLLDNLELADIVVTADADLRHLWRSNSAVDCYRRNLSFYANLHLDIDSRRGIVVQNAQVHGAPTALTVTLTPERTLAPQVLALLLEALARDPRADKSLIISNPPVWQPNL